MLRLSKLETLTVAEPLQANASREVGSVLIPFMIGIIEAGQDGLYSLRYMDRLAEFGWEKLL